MSAEAELAKLGKYHLAEGLEVAAKSLSTHGAHYPVWCVAFSGGKDSTALATVIAHLIDSGDVRAPDVVYLVQVDTLLELPPLQLNSRNIKAAMRSRGWRTVTRSPKPRERLWVQLLGRGLPPANRGFWWCTRSTKQAPQQRVYDMLESRHGSSLLTIYGSRVDESDARAERIAKSCTAAGTECGLGLYSSRENKLAPLAGWRNCAVWDWLRVCERRTRIDVRQLWEAYAAEDQQTVFNWESLSDEQKDAKALEWDIEVDATSRTGCMVCHLAREDKSLRRLCKTKQWSHLSPYLRVVDVVEELRQHHHRVQRPGKGCAGAIRLESRLWALERVLAAQFEVRALAEQRGSQHVDLIPPNDEHLIRQLIDSRTWPANYRSDPVPMPDSVNQDIPPLPGQTSLW